MRALSLLSLLHAQKDAPYADELRAHLSSGYLSTLGLRLLQAGEERAQADVLLVLESPDLADDPDLPALAGDGRLLIPVPLRRVVLAPAPLRGLKPAIDGVILDGGRADPAATAARDPEWVKVALALPPALAAHGRRHPARPAPALTRLREPDPRRPLYIDLAAADGALMVSHRHRGPQGLAPLDPARPGHRAAAPPRISGCDGQALFDLLFPDERWRPLLRALHRTLKTDNAVNPLHLPVALRAHAADPALARLPLHALRFQGFALRDRSWTFEWTAPEAALQVHELLLPVRALLLGAPPPAALAPTLEALAAGVCRRPDGAPDPDALRLHPAGAPALAALHHGDDPACEVLLILGPAPGLPKLLQRLRRPPLLVYCAVPLPEPDLAALRAAVPVVIHQQDAPSEGGDDLLLRFLRHLPCCGDPVAALYRAARAAQRDQAPAFAAFPQVFTRGELHVSAPPRPQLAESPWLKLDRVPQRAHVKREVKEHLLDGALHGLALVVYGAAGNHVGDFLHQIVDELTGTVDLSHHPVAPADPAAPGLPSRTAEALVGSTAVPLGTALATVAAGPGAQLVVLDYGLRPVPAADLERELAALGDWLRFCAAASREPGRPDRVRVLFYLALELDEALHPRLQQLLDEQDDLISERFNFASPQPLGGISPRDLLNFLVDKRHCDCPAHQEREVQRAIYAATRGNYEHTVTLLRRAMDEVGWHRLKLELARGNPS